MGTLPAELSKIVAFIDSSATHMLPFEQNIVPWYLLVGDYVGIAYWGSNLLACIKYDKNGFHFFNLIAQPQTGRPR